MTDTETKPMVCWATPSNPETAAALKPSTRSDDVEIQISLAEYREHRAVDEWEDDWTPATDQLSGRKIKVRKAYCGGACKCAMEVTLDVAE